MAGWRGLVSLAVVVCFGGFAQAQSYLLQEKSLEEGVCHIQLSMELAGKIHIQQDDKVNTLNQTAQASHDYYERVLKTGDDGLASKTARYYKSAKAKIVVEKQTLNRTLRADRSLMVTQQTKEGLLTFSPKGSLTREELELTEHFNTLAVAGLLPGKEVAVGETWKLHNAAAQGLSYLDGLTSHDLTGKLESVKDDKATISISGKSNGIHGGAEVKLTVQATCVFDLKEKRVVSLEWNQKDNREQGPVSPALTAEVTVRMTRQPLAKADELNDFALVPVNAIKEAPASLTALEYSDPKGRYNLEPAREWSPVARTDTHLVMRYLERGDFVAQATVTDWPKAEAGKHMTADEFKNAMAETPGWEQEKMLSAEEVEAEKGYWIYRVSATGKLNGISTVQYYYLVAGPNGNQVVLAFSLTPQQVERLGTRDVDLVRSVRFPEKSK